MTYFEATEPRQRAKKATWKEAMTPNKSSLLLSNIHQVFITEVEIWLAYQSHPARKQTELGSDARILVILSYQVSLLHPQVSNSLEIYHSCNVPIPTAFQQKIKMLYSDALFFYTMYFGEHRTTEILLNIHIKQLGISSTDPNSPVQLDPAKQKMCSV